MGKSKEQKVFEYMVRHGSITQKEAIDNFASYRLSAIIFKLRKKHTIITENEPNKGGRGTHARYHLIEEGEDHV